MEISTVKKMEKEALKESGIYFNIKGILP